MQESVDTYGIMQMNVHTYTHSIHTLKASKDLTKVFSQLHYDLCGTDAVPHNINSFLDML